MLLQCWSDWMFVASIIPPQVIAAMPHAEDAGPVVAGSANCLIVDDEPSVRRSLSRMLQAQGFTCLEACTGREGLQVLDKTGEIPLIISDMRMP
jgi:PleD family two-component response regulator